MNILHELLNPGNETESSKRYKKFIAEAFDIELRLHF